MKTQHEIGARDLLRLRSCLLDHRSTVVDLSRSSTIESLMRTMILKPAEIETDFAPHLIAVERNKDTRQPLVFQRKKKPLDHRRRSNTLRCRVTRIDAIASTPILVPIAVELTALVRDNVLRSAVAFDDATQKGANVDRLRLFLEDGEAHYARRVVIDDTPHPPGASGQRRVAGREKGQVVEICTAQAESASLAGEGDPRFPAELVAALVASRMGADVFKPLWSITLRGHSERWQRIGLCRQKA